MNNEYVDRNSYKRKQSDSENYDSGQYQQQRKRVDDSGGMSSYYTHNKNDVFVKMLIPSTLAGTIIGHGGDRISQLQTEANCRVKMSKANEFYPHTNERICLVIGSIESVFKAYDIIVERINEKVASGAEQSDRIHQIKLLIPNSTAGQIIGRAGSYIKQIIDESGAFVKISPKDENTPERILTIESGGDEQKRFKAFEMIVKKLAKDPGHNSVPNLSYSQSNPVSQQSSSNIQGNADSFGMQNMFDQNSNYSAQQIVARAIPDFNSAAYNISGVNNLALLIINCGGSFQMTPEGLKVKK
jgi:hypothetical protein